MKPNYKMIKTFVVLFSMIAMRLGAQLSGAYTINGGQVTGGTNYQTFTAFATAINTGGVSGPVTVNVVANSGPYNEQVTFNQFTGATAINSVTINGNSNTVTFLGTSIAPHTFLLNGTDFLSVNNLTLTGTSTAGAMVVHLYNGANDNTFTNCAIDCPANGTGNKQCPISISGSANVVQSAGLAGDNNTFQGCTLFGGYWGVCFYGNPGSPANTNNKVLNSTIRDFYYYGIYNYYTTATVARGNTLERPTRTVFTTTYGIYIGYQPSGAGMVVEKNKIRNMFGGNPGVSQTIFCIYNSCSGILGGEVIVRNNVISDIHNSSTLYGYYNGGYSYDIVEHNTFVFDSQISTTGTVYGIMTYNSYNNGKYRNNIVSMARTGSGQKTGFYYLYPNVSNYNVLYLNSTQGVNYYAYDGATYHTTFASFQQGQYGFDANSVSANPMFANPTLYDYTPTNPAINNIGFPLGILTDITGFARNLPAPDAGAYEFFNQSCTGTPTGNSVLTPTYVVCPAAMSAITLANSYTVNGLTYAWGTSTTSAFGPFTTIPGATLASVTTATLPVSTWYTATISCAGFGSPLIVAAGQVTVAGTIISTVPYFENFEGIQANNALPNCSWAKTTANAQTYTSPQNQNRIPRSGSKFASFYYTPAGTNAFYTNGIQLYAGVTYSASMWYTTEYYGYTTFNLSMMVGPSQSTLGMQMIANDPVAVSPSYKQLANTFTVATSGIYYVQIQSVSSGACCAYYLTWDDLSITIPCELNVPALTVTAPSSVCAGQPINLVASGVNNYSWNTGANTATLTDSPSNSTVYSVVGTSTLTNCSKTIVKNVMVRPTPNVIIISLNPNVCAGSAIQLNAAGGAASYTWNTGATTSILTDTPTASTTYSLQGSNVYGCKATATQMVNVNALPNITASSSQPLSCEGQFVTFTGLGGVTYQWVANTAFVQGGMVSVNPNINTTYTLTGTDANGCSAKVTLVQQVQNCTSIKTNNASMIGLNVYPNPTTGAFSIELVNGLDKTVTVSDVTGRVISTTTSSNDLINMNIQTLANGIYYVIVKSNGGVEVMKMVKQ